MRIKVIYQEQIEKKAFTIRQHYLNIIKTEINNIPKITQLLNNKLEKDKKKHMKRYANDNYPIGKIVIKNITEIY